MKFKKSHYFVLSFSVVILIAAVLIFLCTNIEILAPAEDASVNSPATTELKTIQSTEGEKPYFISESDFILYIKSKYFEGYTETTAEAWKTDSEIVLAAPGYIPENFKPYESIFIKPDLGIPTQIMIGQLWYDPLDFEILTITQEETDSPDSNGGIAIEPASWNEAGDTCPWARYCGTYPQVTNGVSIYGFMLVNDETDQDACKKILESIK